eukprot:TRINITY_DN1342_c0_g1_i1.p1 TRINITY_DN1342_c0_g1~~TRINITY_DN1342_c0_g1_i1.p1  ORF type:complete len:228 (-),score=21.20 TRINITY_DN1342_c0_g1_i1:51-734(-)
MVKPQYYSNISKSELSHVFRCAGSVAIPLLDERLSVLQEAGKVLLDKFGGSFVNCVKEANGSAKRLLQLIVDNFNSYRDECDFMGRTVKFYKRAQILIADLWACFEGQGYGAFDDIDVITMFADYRVPQILVSLGVLKYSESLLERLKVNPFIPARDRLEIEIRGCSIWSVEVLKQKLIKKLNEKGIASVSHNQRVNSITIDFYLWDLAVSLPNCPVPIHKTRSIFY